jgi:hypothetical protein
MMCLCRLLCLQCRSEYSYSQAIWPDKLLTYLNVSHKSICLYFKISNLKIADNIQLHTLQDLCFF